MEPALSEVEWEKVDDGNTTKQKCYINSPAGRVAIYTQTYDLHTFATTYDTKYCHRDHLGSVDVITDSTGAVLERDSFDAWGFRRTTDWQAQRPIGSTSIVSRGFTDHVQLDSLGLVNMNGRIYDPGIGRFLSADPFVQAPAVTQNFNRYSYVVNNPLSFSDPTGFNIFGDFFNWLNNTIGPTGTKIVIGVVAAVVSIAAWYAVPAILPGLCTVTLASGATALSSTGAIVAAVGAGFAGGFTSTILSGGSLGQAFESGLIGGAIAGVTAGLLEFGLPALSHALNGDQQTLFYETHADAEGGAVVSNNPVQPEAYENQAVAFDAHGIRADFVQEAADRAAKQGFFTMGRGLPHLIAFHQSNGYFADIIETGADMFSHQGTPLSQGLAEGLSHFDLANSFALAHSGGAAVLNRALELAARNGVSVAGLHVGIEGGAVNYALTQAEYRRLGVTLDFANGHALDMVPQIVGGNSITSFRPWRIITSILGIPFIRTVHTYPYGEVYPAIP